MSEVGYAEIEPGLLTFLDNRIVRHGKGCLCSTPVTDGIIHGTNRDGPFLVVAVNETDNTCLCAPLYGNDGPDRIRLNRTMKTGPGRGWREGDSYIHTHEFWIIPFSVYVSASHIEKSARGNRQRYAQGRPEVLADIAGHKDDSGSPFIPIAN